MADPAQGERSLAAVEVRPAAESDVPAIADLAARTFPLACPPTTRPEDIAEHIATTLSPGQFRLDLQEHTVVVARAGDNLVGYTMLTETPAPVDVRWQDGLELRRIYVDPQWHAGGVADALMADALLRAAKRGKDYLWLGTNEHNTRAIRFYRRHGFDVVGRRTFFVAGAAECDYVMGRAVGPGERGSDA